MFPKWIRDTFEAWTWTVDRLFGHDYDLPVSDAGAERLAELEQEREAWEANELFDRAGTGCECGAGYGGECLTEVEQSPPLAGVQRAASSREESGETPDPSPSLGRTDAELLLAAAAVIEMDGADMLAELAADLRKRADELTNITPLRNLT